MIFLTAEWQHLIMANYRIDPEILAPYIPNGTTLDYYKGHCYVSLVGFLFKNTKVLGCSVPFHKNFEEVNLRFYVQHHGKRGVVFIKELVPKPLITAVANARYHEHYQTVPMAHDWNEKQHDYAYKWTLKNRPQELRIETHPYWLELQPASEAEFIAEHYYGYTKHGQQTFEYEVQHPKWKYQVAKNYRILVDFESNYGTAFKVLNKTNPTSVFLACGSPISVHAKRCINTVYPL